METGKVIEKIRKENRLTQKQFAKKFFVTEKTISNYENGQRNPDMDFLKRVCEEFNLTLDCFAEKPNKESNAKDLIVSKKNRKYAIFDKSQSIYLTSHIYDRILLSRYNYHIVQKFEDEDEEDDDFYLKPNVTVVPLDIIYNAVVDNNGELIEYPGLVFGNPGPFNLFGITIATDNDSIDNFLVNYKGERLCESYGMIKPVDGDLDNLMDCDFGIYYAYTFDRTDKKNSIKSIILLDKDGNKIDFNLDGVMEYCLKVAEFDDIDVLVENIKKYGPNMIALTSGLVFKKATNYMKVVRAVCDFYGNLEEKYKNYAIFDYTFKTLLKYTQKYKPQLDCKKEELDWGFDLLFDGDDLRGKKFEEELHFLNSTLYNQKF